MTKISLMPLDQKDVYRNIRNYLAGRLIGATRDRALLDEVSKCLFCKVFLNSRARKCKVSDPLEVSQTYRKAFSDIKKNLSDLFDKTEEILLDPTSLAYVDEQLSYLDLNNHDRDPIGDLYEAFASSALRQQEGQFFTPQNAIKWLVDIIDPQPGEKIIDPACGAGGFLSYAAKHLLNKGLKGADVAKQIYGIEKDKYLSKLAKAHLAISTLYHSSLICGDSLALKDENQKDFANKYIGKFDIVLANPPFGAKIDSASEELRKEFQLAYKWKLDKKNQTHTITQTLSSRTPPQVLFIERMASLLKEGGRMGIVVPESLLSSAGYSYVVQFIRENFKIKAIVGMPEDLFKSSGKNGTHTKTCLIVAEKNKNSSYHNSTFFMAEAKWCGNDSRGKKISKDDLPIIYNDFVTKKNLKIGYMIEEADIMNNILAPRYYNPEVSRQMSQLKKTHDLISIAELERMGLLSLSTGDEPGKMAYGTGDIPFIRTSDISNWEIKVDPKHCVSEEIFQQYQKRQDVRAGDILMVRDGTYLIGSCAFVSKYDQKILYQSHIIKFRCNDPEKFSPFLLLALLSSEPVQAQIKSKRFTQDIIDSIGSRIYEVVLPIPKSDIHRKRIIEITNRAILERIEARELTRAAKKAVIDETWADASNLNYLVAL